MTKTPDVIAGQAIASTWGNQIRDRSLQVFTSTADRDSGWPAANAPLGAHCVTTDSGIIWEKVGSAWVPSIGAVPSFANTASRDAAWLSPANGSQCITTDTNTTWIYYGGRWNPQQVYASGAYTATTIGVADTALVLAANYTTRLMNKQTASRIQALHPGMYAVAPSLTCYAAAGNASGECWLQVKKFDAAGNFVYAWASVQYLAGTTWYSRMGAFWLVSLSVNEAVETFLRIQTPAGGFAVQGDPNSFLSIYRVSNI